MHIILARRAFDILFRFRLACLLYERSLSFGKRQDTFEFHIGREEIEVRAS